MDRRALSVFVAIDLDERARAEVAGVIDQHRASVEAKWLPPQKLHLTVVFLGNPQPEPLIPKLDALAATAKPFSLELTGSGIFETERAAAVLWLGVGGDLEQLRALQRAASQQLGDEPREYVPHVTLGRAHVPGAYDETARALQRFRGARFEVRHLTLYESTHHSFRVVKTSAFPPTSR